MIGNWWRALTGFPGTRSRYESRGVGGGGFRLKILGVLVTTHGIVRGKAPPYKHHLYCIPQ